FITVRGPRPRRGAFGRRRIAPVVVRGARHRKPDSTLYGAARSSRRRSSASCTGRPPGWRAMPPPVHRAGKAAIIRGAYASALARDEDRARGRAGDLGRDASEARPGGAAGAARAEDHQRGLVLVGGLDERRGGPPAQQPSARP